MSEEFKANKKTLDIKNLVGFKVDIDIANKYYICTSVTKILNNVKRFKEKFIKYPE